jgi:hypothetical protein
MVAAEKRTRNGIKDALFQPLLQTMMMMMISFTLTLRLDGDMQATTTF